MSTSYPYEVVVHATDGDRDVNVPVTEFDDLAYARAWCEQGRLLEWVADNGVARGGVSWNATIARRLPGSFEREVLNRYDEADLRDLDRQANRS